jgi:hypothetical protein
MSPLAPRRTGAGIGALVLAVVLSGFVVAVVDQPTPVADAAGPSAAPTRHTVSPSAPPVATAAPTTSLAATPSAEPTPTDSSSAIPAAPSASTPPRLRRTGRRRRHRPLHPPSSAR